MQHRSRSCKQGTEIPLVLLHRQVISGAGQVEMLEPVM